MRIEHRGRSPRIDPGATVAPGAIVSGDVVIVRHRGRARRIGSGRTVGPHAHVNGGTIGDRAFIATGASVFPGAVIGEGAEVRINGVVQVNTTLEPGTVVPIGWMAVGTPAQLFSPDRHEEIWAIAAGARLPRHRLRLDRSTGMAEIMRRQSSFYAAHDDDRIID